MKEIWTQTPLTSSIVNIYLDLYNTQSLNITCYRQSLFLVCLFLKLSTSLCFNTVTDLIVVDSLVNDSRYTVIYYLNSYINNNNLALITKISTNVSLLSLEFIFPSLNWAEREVWDMFGIFFFKHSDLRRILTDYGFIGHPLQKDFPLTGYK